MGLFRLIGIPVRYFIVLLTFLILFSISSCNDTTSTSKIISNVNSILDTNVLEVYEIDYSKNDTNFITFYKFIKFKKEVPKNFFMHYFGKGKIYCPSELGLPDVFPEQFLIESLGYIISHYEISYGSAFFYNGYKYDNNGLLFESLEYFQDKKYSYQSYSNNRLNEIKYIPNDNFVFIDRFNYNSKGFITNRINFENGYATDTIYYDYDDKDRLISYYNFEYYQDKLTDYYKKNFTYDYNDNLTKIVIQHNSNIEEYATYKYDSLGNIIEIKEVGNVIWEISYIGDKLQEATYNYDNYKRSFLYVYE